MVLRYKRRKTSLNQWTTTITILPGLSSSNIEQRWGTYHVLQAQRDECTSTPWVPTDLRCGCPWSRGRRDRPWLDGGESVSCCTAEWRAPALRPTPERCNCPGGVAPEAGWASGSWWDPCSPPPGSWCTLAGWRSHGPEREERVRDTHWQVTSSSFAALLP